VEKLVIIPTYNEKENIETILQAIFDLKQNFHVLVIDDGSPDGTAGIVKQLQPRFDNTVFLEERKGKLGLGTAYIHGFKWATSRGYNFIFEMDADFSHNPADLPNLYNACKNEGADMAIGSRYIKGGGVKNWPADRIALSKGGSLYTRMILVTPLHDRVIVKPLQLKKKLPVVLLFLTQQKKNHSVVPLSLQVLVKKMNLLQ
jgi:dolichol-phosphate mannosyltransferase